MSEMSNATGFNPAITNRFSIENICKRHYKISELPILLQGVKLHLFRRIEHNLGIVNKRSGFLGLKPIKEIATAQATFLNDAENSVSLTATIGGLDGLLFLTPVVVIRSEEGNILKTIYHTGFCRRVKFVLNSKQYAEIMPAPNYIGRLGIGFYPFWRLYVGVEHS